MNNTYLYPLLPGEQIFITEFFEVQFISDP